MALRDIQSHGDFVIVKLGGSVITQRNGRFDIENVCSLAREIAEYGQAVLVIHGGGVFTKRVLLQHGVESDFLSSAQQAVVRQFRTAMQRLNKDLLNVFKSFSLKCVSIVPHTFLTSNGGEIRGDDQNEIRELLASGVNPVLSGDVLEDEEGGYYTCSSDQIASYLTRILKPRAVLFLTDVDGVYEHYPPPSDQAEPLPIADSGVLHHMRHNYRVGKGDMYGKLAEAVTCAPFTEFCCILNGRVRGNLINALRHHSCVGTRVM